MKRLISGIKSKINNFKYFCFKYFNDYIILCQDSEKNKFLSRLLFDECIYYRNLPKRLEINKNYKISTYLRKKAMYIAEYSTYKDDLKDLYEIDTDKSTFYKIDQLPKYDDSVTKLTYYDYFYNNGNYMSLDDKYCKSQQWEKVFNDLMLKENNEMLYKSFNSNVQLREMIDYEFLTATSAIHENIYIKLNVDKINLETSKKQTKDIVITIQYNKTVQCHRCSQHNTFCKECFNKKVITNSMIKQKLLLSKENLENFIESKNQEIFITYKGLGNYNKYFNGSGDLILNIYKQKQENI